MLMWVCSKSRHEAAKTLCTQILAHLTRDRNNIFLLVFHVDGFLNVLIEASASDDVVRKQHAWWAIQNISYNKKCHKELGTMPKLLENLCKCCQVVEENYETQIACMVTLRNVCQRLENVKQMFDIPSCTTTIFAFIWTRELNKGRPELIYLASETLNAVCLLLNDSIEKNSPTDVTGNLDGAKLPSGKHRCWKPFA